MGPLGSELTLETVRRWIVDLPQTVDVRFSRGAFDLLKRDSENVCSFFAQHGARSDPSDLPHDLWEKYQRAQLEEIMRSGREAVRRLSPCLSIMLRASSRSAPASRQPLLLGPVLRGHPTTDHLETDQLLRPALPERSCYRSCTRRGFRPRCYILIKRGDG